MHKLYLGLGSNLGNRIQNIQKAIEMIDEAKPDVVLMDIRMPKLYGLEVIEQAKQQGFSGTFVMNSAS